MYAHSGLNRDRGDWELLETHSLNVARAAGRRGQTFGAGDLARAAGLIHDLGKMKAAFQARLRGDQIRVPHAADGARFAADRFDIMGRFLAFGIADHHGRMPNALGPDGLERTLAAAAV